MKIPATMGIILVNALVFIATLAHPEITTQYGLIPSQISQEPYRLVTSMFLHENIGHILSNMISLYLIGQFVETVMGSRKYVLLYVLGGLGGSLLAWEFAASNSVTIGASGAVFAVFGAMLILSRHNKAQLTNAAVLIAINLFYTFATPNISWEGHVGGLITGMILTAILTRTPKPKLTNTPAYQGEINGKQNYR